MAQPEAQKYRGLEATPNIFAATKEKDASLQEEQAFFAQMEKFSERPMISIEVDRESSSFAVVGALPAQPSGRESPVGVGETVPRSSATYDPGTDTDDSPRLWRPPKKGKGLFSRKPRPESGAAAPAGARAWSPPPPPRPGAAPGSGRPRSRPSEPDRWRRRGEVAVLVGAADAGVAGRGRLPRRRRGRDGPRRDAARAHRRRRGVDARPRRLGLGLRGGGDALSRIGATAHGVEISGSAPNRQASDFDAIFAAVDAADAIEPAGRSHRPPPHRDSSDVACGCMGSWGENIAYDDGCADVGCAGDAWSDGDEAALSTSPDTYLGSVLAYLSMTPATCAGDQRYYETDDEVGLTD
ncbi:hypothetical protein JL721_5721 [Aureococcus anophagefferens]|nr:hypothetical protein JL721_5721 [Aureococcus anophagefferens]